MRFLIDAQLPPALACWLASKGHEADVGLAGAVIISKDEDFAKRKILASEGPAVVWVRVPNTRRRDLLVWFDGVLPQIVRAVERGETLIEVVRPVDADSARWRRRDDGAGGMATLASQAAERVRRRSSNSVSGSNQHRSGRITVGDYGDGHR